jgi:hypothetical protein
MKRRLAILVGIIFLTACGGGGGGGGDGGALWSTTVIQPDTQVSGTLAATDNVAPDGTYFDLYTFTLPNAANISIRMESAAFDTYLYLFQSGVLNQPDINLWDASLLAENDDADNLTSDSAISMTLNAGTYVIAANAFDVAATGDYTLSVEVNTYSVAAPTYLQYRSFENPASDHFRAWIDLRKNNNFIQESDIQSVQLFDVNNMPFAPAVPPQFVSGPYTIASWNTLSGQFEQVAADGQSGFFLNLSNHLSITTGTWTFVAQTTGGATLTYNLNFPGQVSLMPVAAIIMVPVWNLDGSLTLLWTEPADNFEQYRVRLTDASGQDIFYGKVPKGTNQVTLDVGLIQTISQTAQINAPTTVNWSMQTRNYDGSNNYARSVSNAIPIAWP